MADLAFPLDILTRVIKVVHPSENAILSIDCSARPTGIYADATTTVATLSVQGLPLLSPSTFEVNAAEGTFPNYEAQYGGRTSLTLGTLTANWQLRQYPFTGVAFCEVNYVASNWPFFGANTIQIKVKMDLNRLLLPEGAYYEWVAFAGVKIPRLPPGGEPKAKSGIALAGESLICTLDVTMDPPSAQFTVD